PQQLPFSDHSRSAEVKILLPAAPSGAAFLLLVSNKPLNVQIEHNQMATLGSSCLNQGSPSHM
ncbi:hypothetical protein, partial [Vibrio cholerae]|uniref:hypothetical protein n=1 Tax=Vibrio cholerae TaxID=666 RepID=UPI001C8E6558